MKNPSEITEEEITEEKEVELVKEMLRNVYFPKEYKERQAIFIDNVYTPYRNEKEDDIENNDRDDF